MKTISDEELEQRICLDNPWWQEPHQIDDERRAMRHRQYFDLFHPFVTQRDPRRAVVLMGPRRVGKTVMLHQSVQRMIDDGVPPRSICCIDLQSPTYSGISLERLLRLARAASNVEDQPYVMIYDEIQYLGEWEVQLKNAVDKFNDVKFVASGSAAAALRVKSAESGAGRFTDFMLPPVTFCEYLTLIGCEEGSLFDVIETDEDVHLLHTPDDIDDANNHFFNYINYGGYPEAILSETIRSDPGRYIGRDIIEKVLTRDLPSLYGIHDIPELNQLFSMLAYNTAQELSLEELSKKSGVAKATIKRYIDYLEAAFLIKVVHRIDRNAKRFKRANFFKVYLTNPCMRAALFSPIGPDDEHAGSMVETAILSQYFHSDSRLHYARWSGGEVDIVDLEPRMFRPTMSVEVKWTDRFFRKPGELKAMRSFKKKHPKCAAYVTTRTSRGSRIIDGNSLTFFPSATFCYYIGWLALSNKGIEMKARLTGAAESGEAEE